MITKVEALDLASQLGKETVVEYLAESKTIDAIVDELLALQVLTPAITKGTISDSIKDLTRSIQVDGDSILRALYRLRDTVGGYIEVDNDRQLNWLDSIGEDKGQQIRYRKNLKGIEREIDYSKLFNRIYAYGAGEGTARIKLSDAEGQDEDYVEDATSQGAPPAGWGGIYPGVFTERSITHPDTLLAWANLLLGDYKNPPICYRIDAVDLSQSEELGFSFEALQLGSTITVIDEDLGIDVSVTVVKIEHPDLLHPEQMILELANRTKDITDTLAEVYDIQQLGQHVATKIGAGQVIVLGEFSVKDWLTEGTTYIKGDYIRTGVIESTNWGTDAGSQFNLNDGTFKLGGSAAPALSWNGVALTIEGLFGGEWYDKAGVEIDANHGINIYGAANALTTRATKTGTIQCYVGVNGEIFAGAGNVSLSADGIKIKGTSLKFYTTGDDYRGYFSPEAACLYLYGFPDMTIHTSGELNLYGSDFVYIDSNGGVTIEANAGNAGVIMWSSYVKRGGAVSTLGTAGTKWTALYAVTVYEGSPKLQPKCNYLDVVRGIKLHSNGKLDKLSLPEYLVERNPLADMSDEEYAIENKKYQKERQRQLGRTHKSPNGKILKTVVPKDNLSREHSVAIGGLALLAIEGIKTLADKVEALEIKIGG